MPGPPARRGRSRRSRSGFRRKPEATRTSCSDAVRGGRRAGARRPPQDGRRHRRAEDTGSDEQHAHRLGRRADRRCLGRSSRLTSLLATLAHVRQDANQAHIGRWRAELQDAGEGLEPRGVADHDRRRIGDPRRGAGRRQRLEAGQRHVQQPGHGREPAHPDIETTHLLLPGPLPTAAARDVRPADRRLAPRGVLGMKPARRTPTLREVGVKTSSSGAGAHARDSVSVAIAPPSRRLASVTCPPCNPAISRTNARPRPLLFFCVPGRGSEKNLSKTLPPA